MKFIAQLSAFTFLFNLIIFSAKHESKYIGLADSCLLLGFKTDYEIYFEENIIPRKQWKAALPKQGIEQDKTKNKFALHHSAGSSISAEKTIRGIQKYHMENNGWSDVSYNFFIGTDGKCFEGRQLQYKAAHVSGENTGNIGICFLGCFESTEKNFIHPTQEMFQRCAELIAVLAIKYEIELSCSTVKAHKAHKKAKTLCPGDLIMPQIENIIETAVIEKRKFLDS